jgi:hypothetical protein
MPWLMITEVPSTGACCGGDTIAAAAHDWLVEYVV